MKDFLSRLYGKIVESRNRAFDRGRVDVISTGIPVISIGNISAGGTGKTPFSIMLAKKIIELGYMPCIIGRGYKRKRSSLNIISDGKDIIAGIDDAGDEMFMIAKKLPVAVVVDESKSKAAKIAEKKLDIDCIIVDDGFQHRKLERDVDIVLLDDETIKKPFLLPKGRLREPLNSLNRADVIAFGENINSNIIEEYAQNKIWIKTRTEASTVFEIFSGDILKGEALMRKMEKCLAVSGLANPSRFYDSLESAGWNIIDHVTFADHHNYSKRDIEIIVKICKDKNINCIITTEKDAVKLVGFKDFFEKEHIDCYVFSIEMIIMENEKDFYRLIEKTISKA